MNVNVTTEGLPKSESATPFEVERLGARLGAEVHGLDLKNGMNPATFKAFEAALIEHKVCDARLCVTNPSLTSIPVPPVQVRCQRRKRASTLR